MSRVAVESVLLVDDDRVTNLMHTRMLRKAQLASRIEVATDGEAALDVLRAHAAAGTAPPQIVFLDLNMPRMNGFEFISAYRGLPAAARAAQDVVMLTTSILPEDRARADADPDVRTFIVKPLRAEALLSVFAAYHASRTG